MTDLPLTTYTARRHAAARTEEFVYHQLIPYLGNKRKLLGLIQDAVARTGAAQGVFLDLFAGSGVVSRWAKQSGFQVWGNDWEPYARAINQAYLGCNALPAFAALGGAAAVYERLNALAPCPGYVARHLCPSDDAAPDHRRERMFFTQENGARIDAVREQIADWSLRGLLTGPEEAVLLASLLYAASYVSNTSGVFKGFHRGWGGATRTALYRILSRLHLAPPILFDNGQCNRVTSDDAQALAERMRRDGVAAEIAYLDPPYNQHPYGSNYHLLNTLTLWDKPPVSPTISGRDKAAIRTDWRTERRSAYNHRETALAAYRKLLETLPARWILTSYSADGLIPLPALLAAASARGGLTVVTQSYKRYRVSSQRRSPRPRTVEFVLILDTHSPGDPADAERALAQIEKSAGEAGV